MTEDRIFSASKDGVLKLWKRPKTEAVVETDSAVQELSTVRTVLAHNQVGYGTYHYLLSIRGCS